MGFGKKVEWPPGTSVTFKPGARDWLAVESLKGAGYANGADLKRTCSGAAKILAALAQPPPLAVKPKPEAKKQPATQPASQPASAPVLAPQPIPPTLPALTPPKPMARKNEPPLEMIPKKPVPGLEPIPKKSRAPGSDGKLRVAVTGDLTPALAEAVRETLAQLGAFRLAPVADADYLITGTLVASADSSRLSLQLADVKKAYVDREVSKDTMPQDLDATARSVAKLLVHDLLERLSGSVHVTSNVEGATVKLDGAVMGISPLLTFAASGGIHEVAVSHEGYEELTRTIEVAPSRTVELQLDLQPLPETRRRDQVSTQRTRALAWTFFGTGALSIGASSALLGFAVNLADQLNKDIAAYNAAPLRTRATHAEILRGKQLLTTVDALVAVTATLGVAGLTTSIVLFVTGRSTTIQTTHGIEITPTANGLLLTF